ncbi:sugar kinase [Saccharomonospora cyanea]|uniref:Sugar kinase, ribokinase n=1 Tax=Saccharomonospora cyanea NA-134 TaxID=882082 RepID=H5XPR2_9PSEU|nr:sugar kinase [Saccharomonospora cyanea]EHR61140.1 sugar kinase, ribokinase [Saccharomonospora cyanea NA-134]
MSSADTVNTSNTACPDVLVLGEPLVEVSTTEPFRDGASVRLAFSGDALNAAAAAAAAGAHTALLARVPDDELGDALVAKVTELGIDAGTVIRVPGQHGVYFTHSDPSGRRQFAYARSGSAGSALRPEDVTGAVEGAGVVLSSGITAAVSESAAATVLHAAERARRFVYDPNYRPRLTSAQEAAATLRRIAPLAELVTPSWPDEAWSLLGLSTEATPHDAVAATRALGASAVALTRGSDGVLVGTATGAVDVPAPPPPRVVDQTGAGDVFAGTVAARLALGDDLLGAVRLGTAAASLSVQGRGGTGFLPTLAQSRAAVEEVRV